jgi:tRNA threonylcarbamoyladenosine biosynthesis protein TsaB
MSTTLLAFETSTEACSIALWRDGEVRERFEVAPRRHAELALPWAEQLLAESGTVRSQIDAVAVGRGPGAFTGVRLAIALAQGIALALDRPIVPVSTLAALALRSAGPIGTPVLASIDARMGEIYAGRFMRCAEGLQALGDEWLGRPDAYELPDEHAVWRGVGTGFAAQEATLRRRLAERLVEVDDAALPRAGGVVTLAAHAFARGETWAPEKVEPAYLRNDVALTLDQQAALRAAARSPNARA